MFRIRTQYTIPINFIAAAGKGEDMDFVVSEKDRNYLRELAKKQREYALLPIMKQREQRWIRHNMCEGSCKNDLPIILMEIDYCLDDYIDLECESEFARAIERELKRYIVNHELVDDDKVIPDYFTVNWKMEIKPLGFDLSEKRAADQNGKTIGFTTEKQLARLEEDWHKIGKTVRNVDKEYTLQYKEAAETIIGDILPLRIKLARPYNWMTSPGKKVVYLMGTESMMLAPYDYPELFHRLFQLLVDDVLETYDWMIAENLVTLNNGNDYAGAGSYGFTEELPTEQFKKTGQITRKDLWVNLNSQESVGMSAAMYGEFFWPYYKQLADEFGLVYYGCCEPVNETYNYISKIKNLRKISISPWADEEYMAEQIRGTKIVYCRKPSPNYLAAQGEIDEQAFRKHIARSVRIAKGCEMELSVRDVYALYGNRKKLGDAVRIMREEVEKYW